MKLEQSRENEANFKQSAGKEKMYRVTFRENRTFELHLRKDTYRFGPKEHKFVGEDFINHPDFIQQKKYFTVEEVTK